MEIAFKRENGLSEELVFDFVAFLESHLKGGNELDRLARVGGEYFILVSLDFAYSRVYEKFYALPDEIQSCKDQVTIHANTQSYASCFKRNDSECPQNEMIPKASNEMIPSALRGQTTCKLTQKTPMYLHSRAHCPDLATLERNRAAGCCHG